MLVGSDKMYCSKERQNSGRRSRGDKKLKGLKLQAWAYEKALLFLIVTMLATEPLIKRI